MKLGIQAATEYYADTINLPSLLALSNHGRWASKVFGKTIAGPPIDELDSIFRDWFNRRKCILQINGACNSSPSSTEYDVLGSQCSTYF